MIIKKIMNAALCAALASGSVTNVVTPVLANWNDNTNLIYEVTQRYTWVAPSVNSITAGSNGTVVVSGAVEVTENVIPDRSKLQIAIKADQIFEMADTANPENVRTYTVSKDGEALDAGSIILEVESGTNTGIAMLDFQIDAETVEIAGTYNGTINFVSDVCLPNYVINDVDGNSVLSKGDIVTFKESYIYSPGNSGPTEFLVLKSDGSTTELMARANYQNERIAISRNISNDSAGNQVSTYENKDLDYRMNSTYYNSLSDAFKSNIQSKMITAYSWVRYGSESAEVSSWGKDGFGSDDTSGDAYTMSKIGVVNSFERYVYVPDVQDIIDYLGATFTPQQLNVMFFGLNYSVDRSVWLRSSVSGVNYNNIIVSGKKGVIDDAYYQASFESRPTFTISLN